MASVLMPVATVDENDCRVFRENHVRSPRKFLSVKSETESHSKESATKSQLKLRVLRADRRHHAAANQLANRIRYFDSPHESSDCDGDILHQNRKRRASL